MKPYVRILGAMVVLVSVVRLCAAANDGKQSVKSLPPVVVKTVPTAGDTRVDAAKVKAIRVTFSKKMIDGNWSFVQISNDTYPKMTGKIKFAGDGKTCVLPVVLEPGRTYVLWINSDRFNSFKDLDRHPAVPYLLVFETKGAK